MPQVHDLRHFFAETDVFRFRQNEGAHQAPLLHVHGLTGPSDDSVEPVDYFSAATF